jgi:hypothetical protein
LRIADLKTWLKGCSASRLGLAKPTSVDQRWQAADGSVTGRSVSLGRVFTLMAAARPHHGLVSWTVEKRINHDLQIAFATPSARPSRLGGGAASRYDERQRESFRLDLVSRR